MRKMLKFVLVIVITVGFLTPISMVIAEDKDSPVDNTNWWKTSWLYLKLITIDHTIVDTPLVNSPLRGYNLNITIQGQGTVTKNPDQPSYNDSQVVNLTAIPATGWIFNHWGGDLNGSQNPMNITINGNKTVTANFSVTSGYALDITIQGQGTVTKNPDQTTYTYGQVVSLTAMPAAGWLFNHWAGNITGSQNPVNITMNGNRSVVANFTITSGYLLNITIQGQGTVTKDPDQTNYTYGQVVTLTAIPATGWVFDHWAGDLNDSQNPVNITMNGNRTVTVNFAITSGYTLNITIQGQGTVTKDPDQTNYTYGQVVTLTAIPATGWVFDYWAGDLNDSQNPVNITMNGNRSVIANFTITSGNIQIIGPSIGAKETPLNFTVIVVEFEGEQLYYQWNWGDGNYTDWLGPIPSSIPLTTSYAWATDGVYNITAKARSIEGAESNWSAPHVISIQPLVNLSNIKLGYVYFKIFTYNQSYLYSNFLERLRISAILTTEALEVEAGAADIVESVTFSAMHLSQFDTYEYVDDNRSDGFTCVFNISRGFYELNVTAYDGNGTVLDRSSIPTFWYFRIGKYAFGPDEETPRHLLRLPRLRH